MWNPLLRIQVYYRVFPISVRQQWFLYFYRPIRCAGRAEASIPLPCARWPGHTLHLLQGWLSWHAVPARNCQRSCDTLHLQTLPLINRKSSTAGCSICILQLWNQTEQRHTRGLTHSHFQGNKSIFETKRRKDAWDLTRKIIMKEAEKQKSKEKAHVKTVGQKSK